jgi:phage protein U
MPVPMIDDIELKAVQHVRQETAASFAEQHVIGLNGTLHQKMGRRSHRVELRGFLLPDTAVDDLKKLQEKSSKGEEVTFTADITTALTIDKMLVERFQAEQQVGPPGQIAYQIVLVESPPLPPPAQVSAFGGLDGFGLGDLGFDAGALGDLLSEIQDQAGAVMDAVDAAVDAVQQLASLASLADLANIANPLMPLTSKVGELGQLSEPVAGLTTALGDIQP